MKNANTNKEIIDILARKPYNKADSLRGEKNRFLLSEVNIMACKQKMEDRYVYAIFELARKKDRMDFSIENRHFNMTEMRLIAEILAAKREGKRLISTQLAKLLGVTRSAVSQIVNNLEKENVVKRVADEVDRKIAWIECTDEMLERYKDDMKTCVNFMAEVISVYGSEKFDEMYRLVDEFYDIVADVKEKFDDKKSRKK